ncbi:helix-turn-helix transcriptional regulator [Erysipelothrix sp. Poltava]|nr:helix-turn-helix transcriptional regulator [Erysipelothrix sp. Poltava]
MVNEINKYILNNICEPISVEDLCDHFAISRSSLHVLFKKNMDMPPKQYINDIKMMRAQVMILEENLPITEVAMRLGFSSIHYFSRKFKKQFGLSPTEYAQSLYNKNTSDD